MLDHVRTTTCSRKERIAEGKEGVLVYVGMNIYYSPTVSKQGLHRTTSILALVQLAGHTVVMEQSLLHTPTLRPNAIHQIFIK